MISVKFTNQKPVKVNVGEGFPYSHEIKGRRVLIDFHLIHGHHYIGIPSSDKQQDIGVWDDHQTSRTEKVSEE